MPPVVRITHSHSRLRPPTEKLQKRLLDLLRAEASLSSPAVEIILTGDGPVRELNRRFRKKDRATDVLSFNFNDTDLLGEIYISLDTAKKQASEMGHSLETEVQRLAVHGLFHLLGFDHHRKNERIRMERLEAHYQQ